MRVVSYRLRNRDTLISMTPPAQPLHVDMEHGVAYVYAMGGAPGPPTQRRFFIVETGDETPRGTGILYVGSIHQHAPTGEYLWHVFCRKEEPNDTQDQLIAEATGRSLEELT